MNRSGLFLLMFAIVVAVVATSLNTYWLTYKEFTFSKNTKKIDYYLSDFTLLNTQSNGEMRYHIKAQHLIHQQSTGKSEIFQPFFQARSNGNATLTLQSKKAQQLDKDGTIQLLGDVTVQKNSDLDSERFQLKTQDLNYNPLEKLLSSSSKIQLQSDSGTIQGVGFKTKLDEQELRIFSDVRIEYKPTH